MGYQSVVKLLKDYDSLWVDTTIYRQFVGIMFYFMHNRPYLCFFVSVVFIFIQDPRKSHWKVAKRIVLYIKGTYQYGIKYYRSTKPLSSNTNSDYGGYIEDQKSSSCYVFSLSGAPLVLSCKKHKIVSLFSTEVDYCSVVNARTKAFCLHQLLDELGFPIHTSTVIYCDNLGTIQLVDIHVSHSKMNHVEHHVHYSI